MYTIYALLLVSIILTAIILRKNKSFLSNGISIKDLIILVMCFTLVFVMISYLWTINELMRFINEGNAVTLVTEFLKYMLYVILCFIIPYVLVVTYYFLTERNADGIAKLLDRIPFGKNIKITSSEKDDDDIDKGAGWFQLQFYYLWKIYITIN